MAIDVAWSAIVDGQVDADSPLNQILMQSIKDNLYHLELWLGKDYTAANNHDHDEVNSKTVILGDSTVSQAKLKTSTGSVSHNTDTPASKTLPGGEYGFYPQIKMSHAAGAVWEAHITEGVTGFASYTTHIALKSQDASTTYTIYAQQRYVASSGEVYWVFILRTKLDEIIEGKDFYGNPLTYNRSAGTIMSVWQAPDHPCFGNSGKPQLAPHPFPGYDESKCEIIVINPPKEQVLEMQKKAIVGSEIEPDKDLIEVILEEYSLDESTEPDWPSTPVTVGLPLEWEEKAIGDKIEPIKKAIPKPAGIKTALLVAKAAKK